MKKKLKLKKEVKGVLIVLTVLTVVLLIHDNWQTKEINKCVEAGNDRAYCERVLK